MFAVTVTFHLHPGQMEAFLPLVVQNAQTSLQDEPGCHKFDVCHGNSAGTVFLYELYTDAAAFDAHLATPHFLTFSDQTEQMVAHKEVNTFTEVAQ